MTLKPLLTISTGIVLLGLAGGAFGHGLIESPPSRNWFCGAITKPDEVSNGVAEFPVCGDAFAIDFTAGYNFMSVLTHTQGRSVVGPRTNVCGFNSETWSGAATVWDQPINWPTTNLTSGPQVFTWNISWGPHFSDTQEFRYWITKPSFQFQVGRPLTFADFEDQPFCTLNYNDANPTGNPAVVAEPANALFHTTCNVPARSGRHVIYAEWGRNQFTFERFHSCIDAVFSGGGVPAPSAQVSLNPNVTAFVGAGTITLNGSASTGEGLTYRWSVNTVDAAAHTITNSTQPIATLNLADVRAASLLTISLIVSNSVGSDTETFTLIHRPSVASPWTDLGPLTAESRALTANDRISVRTVQTGGQDAFFPNTPVLITAATAGAAAWPVALAQAVNAQGGNIQIGVLNAQGQVVPAQNATSNRVYALTTANVTGAFLQVVTGSPGCHVNYSISSQWNGGFQTNVTVTNQSPTVPVVGYSLNWTFGAGQTFGSGWNATFTPSGQAVTASNTAGHWNGVIRQGGGTVNFGFNGVKGSAPATVPTDFRLNGLPCSVGGTTAALPPNGAVQPAGGQQNRTGNGTALAIALGLGLLAVPAAAWRIAARTRRRRVA